MLRLQKTVHWQCCDAFDSSSCHVSSKVSLFNADSELVLRSIATFVGVPFRSGFVSSVIFAAHVALNSGSADRVGINLA